MQALRQFHTAEQGVITIELPEDFPSTEVEVIILPKESVATRIAARQDDEQSAIQEFFTTDTSRFSVEQQQAYERACKRLRQGRKVGSPPILGLMEGLIEVDDSFDAPLPSEVVDLFDGTETDEYGLSIEP